MQVSIQYVTVTSPITRLGQDTGRLASSMSWGEGGGGGGGGVLMIEMVFFSMQSSEEH